MKYRALKACMLVGLVAIPLASHSSFATTVFSDTFDADTKVSGSSNYVAQGWTDVTNYTTSDTTDTTSITGPTVAGSGAGYPFVDHTSGSGNFVAFQNANLGPTGTAFDKFFIAPALTLNGSAATFSFYAFSTSNVSTISVLLSTDGSGNVPNYGADFVGTTTTTLDSTTSASGTYDNGKTPYTGVQTGDFATTLLSSFTPTVYAGGSTPWTLYTASIPAGLATAYVAIRETGTASAYPANPSFIGIDDVSVNTVPEPASIGVLSLGAFAGIRRRRSAQ